MTIQYTFMQNDAAVFDLQYDWYCKKELPRGCVLSAVINLLPVGQPPGIPLVGSNVGCALQVVEHDVHALRGGGGGNYIVMMSLFVIPSTQLVLLSSYNNEIHLQPFRIG